MFLKRVWSRPKHCQILRNGAYGPSRTSLLDFKSYLLGGMRPSRPTILRNSSLMQRLELRGLGLIASKTRTGTERLILIWCGEAGRYSESGRQLDGVFALASAREIVWSHGLSPGADPLL